MAAGPAYFDVPVIHYANLTTGVTATDGSGAITTPTWWGAAVPTTIWMIVNIIISSASATGVGDLADCLFHIYTREATAGVKRIRTVDLGNPAAASVTTDALGALVIPFGPEWLIPANGDLRYSISVTPTAGSLDVVMFGQKSST